VVGAAYNSAGDAYNGTTLGLGNTIVTNDGTLVLDAQGSGKTSGGPATVTSGTIRNNGTIVAEVQDPAWTVQLQAGIANQHKGALTLTGGTLTDSGGAVTNDGTVTLGQATTFLLQEAATFANKSDGTIVTDIANVKSSDSSPLPAPVVPDRGCSPPVAAFSPSSPAGTNPRPTRISSCSCSRAASSAAASVVLAAVSQLTMATSQRAPRSSVSSIATCHRAGPS